jgi:urea carboxylase
MEGPGGYQFVGRTVQVWSSHGTRGPFEKPWLLRHFDRIRWYPVSAEELTGLREEMAAGRLDVAIERGTFSLSAHLDLLSREAPAIAAFKTRQSAAFAAERDEWERRGEFEERAAATPAAR